MVVNFPSNKKYSQRVNGIKILFDIRTLDIFCRYIMSTSSYLRINHIMNLGKLIRNLDSSMYEMDPEKIKRIHFLLRAIEARLDYKLTDINMIWIHIMNNIDVDIDFLGEKIEELDKKSILWINDMVADSLQYAFVYEDADRMLDLCTRIINSDYNNRGTLVQQYEQLIDHGKNEFRRTKAAHNAMDMTFSLRSGVFEQAVTDTYNIVTSPSRFLITGMQGLNEMLGGGFESERVYMFVGITGVGKSLTLLNLAYQIKMFNKNYKTKDPTKTPCIVILTMENSVVETITRLFDLVVKESVGMANYTLEEVLRKLREEGELKLTDESPIDIVIKYKANRSVDTSYLYTLCDDLEDDGYEVICLFQDHVKRIRSSESFNDVRIELGEVVNDFKAFATERGIPVISDTHFNRETIKMAEEAATKNVQVDITKRMGKGGISESMLMWDNLDYGIAINLDYDENGYKHMAFYLNKQRSNSDRNYFVQPFVYGNPIRLVSDVGGVPMFKESLHQVPQYQNAASIRSSSVSAITVPQMEANKENSFINDAIHSFQIEREEPIVEFQKPRIMDPFEYVRTNKPNVQDLKEIKNKLFGQKAM